MKKILISLSIVGAVAAVVVYGTTAFFSDTETSTGNTFTAGAIDLQVDSTASYNGQRVDSATWALKDLVPTADKFFNFSDIKPGDEGENTISLHVVNNDAYVCAAVSNLTSADNGENEPEALVDQSSDVNEGELDDTMVWTVWRDDASTNGAVPGDNIYQDGEQVLASGHPVNGVMAVYDSTTATGALVGGSTAYLGVSWSLPVETGNEVQTDSLTGDIGFTVVQSRNNADFRCVPRPLAFVLTDPSEQNALNSASENYPWYTYDVDGLCIDFTLHNPNSWPAYFDYAIDGDLGSPVTGISDVIGHEGPFNGLPLGNLHSGSTNVPAHQTALVNKCGTSELKIGIHYGAEQRSYLDWATFTAQ